MADESPEQARTQALLDQRWAEAENLHNDIVRIGMQGPNGSERDASIVKKVMMLVGSELMQRNSIRRSIDPEV